MIRWFVVALVVLLVVPAVAGAATGPMKIHYYQRPGSACASTDPTAAGAKKYTSAVSQTGLAFDGSELLVSCWGDGSILKVSEAGGVLGQLQVTGVNGLGGISWDADHARVGELADIGRDAVQLVESQPPGGRAGAAGVDQCAVDVEQDRDAFGGQGEPPHAGA